MADPTLSFVIPTVGRESLARTLKGISSQAGPDDEVIVVGDGHRARAEQMFAESGLPGRYCFTSPTGGWGQMQRILGIGFASRDFLVFIDDDDAHLPGAIRSVRKIVSSSPGLYLFKVRFPDGNVVPKQPKVKVGNVTTSGIVASNAPGKIGKWGPNYGGDGDFAVRTASLWGPDHVFFPDLLLAQYRTLDTEVPFA